MTKNTNHFKICGIMRSNKRHALIVGASGAVGQQLLQQLISSPLYEMIHAPVRTELNHSDSKLKTYPFHQFLFEANEVLRVDDIFYCFGSTQKKAGSREKFRNIELSVAHALQLLAKRCQVQRFFLISSHGVDPASMFAYLRVKADVEKIIQDHHFHNLFIYRPQLIIAKRDEFRMGEAIAQFFMKPIKGLFQRFFPEYAPVSALQIAQAMMSDAQGQDQGLMIRENKNIIELAVQ
jgi:uncharacterized protein YbjT (DUF2867 family)